MGRTEEKIQRKNSLSVTDKHTCTASTALQSFLKVKYEDVGHKMKQ